MTARRVHELDYCLLPEIFMNSDSKKRIIFKNEVDVVTNDHNTKLSVIYETRYLLV